MLNLHYYNTLSVKLQHVHPHIPLTAIHDVMVPVQHILIKTIVVIVLTHILELIIFGGIKLLPLRLTISGVHPLAPLNIGQIQVILYTNALHVIHYVKLVPILAIPTALHV